MMLGTMAFLKPSASTASISSSYQTTVCSDLPLTSPMSSLLLPVRVHEPK